MHTGPQMQCIEGLMRAVCCLCVKSAVCHRPDESCLLSVCKNSQCIIGLMRAVWCVQSNVIEAAPDMQRDSEKEWYYGNADKERLGPYSFDEVNYIYCCWVSSLISSCTNAEVVRSTLFTVNALYKLLTYLLVPMFQFGTGRPQCGSISHPLWFQSKLDTQWESTRFFL